MRVQITQAAQIYAALANNAIQAAIKQQQAITDDKLADARKGQNLDVKA